jgi:hypothetical protein
VVGARRLLHLARDPRVRALVVALELFQCGLASRAGLNAATKLCRPAKHDEYGLADTPAHRRIIAAAEAVARLAACHAGEERCLWPDQMLVSFAAADLKGLSKNTIPTVCERAGMKAGIIAITLAELGLAPLPA